MERLIEHEALQMATLQWLGSKRFLASLAFGGETMLRLCHELPRYSLGLDFSFFKEESYDGFYDRLYTAFSQDHNISNAQNRDHLPAALRRRSPSHLIFPPRFWLEDSPCNRCYKTRFYLC
jgi:hypothetical protein